MPKTRSDVELSSVSGDAAPANVTAKRLARLPAMARVEHLVPARMVNEVLYCERLMYLEWVQGEFADNYFTVDGRAVHRRADARAKPLRPSKAGAGTSEVDSSNGDDRAESDDKPYSARSVWLSSEALGVTSKIDVVDVDETGLNVIPIEYKRGKRPDVPEGAYLPERAQVCVQALLLREHGFHCDHAEIYFAADRKRVPIELSKALIETTLGAIERAKALGAEGVLPAPLIDSPKCMVVLWLGFACPTKSPPCGTPNRRIDPMRNPRQSSQRIHGAWLRLRTIVLYDDYIQRGTTACPCSFRSKVLALDWMANAWRSGVRRRAPRSRDGSRIRPK